MEKVVALIGAQVERIPEQVIRQVDKRVKEEMAIIWDQRPHAWEQVTRDIIQQEIEDALERSLPQEMEDFKETLKDECINEMQHYMGEGLVSITFPR